MATPAKWKKFVKIVDNPQTWRTKKVSYWAKGYSISPWTKKGDAYCARSYWIMKKHPSAKDPNSPNSLSRKKWKCVWKKSMK